MIDKLLKAVKTRYNYLVIEMNEDYDYHVENGTGKSQIEIYLDWLNDILEQTNIHEPDNCLDLAAAAILKEELIIAAQS